VRISITSPHLFIPGSNPVENAETLKVWLEALIDTNRVYLDFHPETPPLYKAGVHYARTDDWDPIAVLFRPGYHGTDLPWCRVPKHYGVFGDCKSLSAARIAQLRKAGKVAKPQFRYDEKPILAPPGSYNRDEGVWTAEGRCVVPDGMLAPDNRRIIGADGKLKTRLVYHILVQTGINSYEDPSKLCGMTDNEWAYMT
jgi:hypothetical protein